MVQPKVFISAPVTGRDREERKRFFRQVEQNLKDLGFYPVNPMKNGAPSTAKHATHMKASLRKLLCSDYYIQALDSVGSAGCFVEEQIAEACGIEYIGSIHSYGKVCLNSRGKRVSKAVKRFVQEVQ